MSARRSRAGWPPGRAARGGACGWRRWTFGRPTPRARSLPPSRASSTRSGENPGGPKRVDRFVSASGIQRESASAGERREENCMFIEKQSLDGLGIDRAEDRGSGGRGRWIVLGLLVLAAALGIYFWLSRPRAIEVETAAAVEVPSGSVAAVLNASGYVTARRQATVSSKITGKVIEVLVEEGMAVTEGQVLARLDPATV